MSLAALVPSPGARVDWDALFRACPWLDELSRCQQDPGYHAEGDVAVHTRMVLEALVAMPRWQALAQADREVLFLAALFHDIAKPACTQTEPDGRITSPGHSQKGALQTRALLYRAGHPAEKREAIAGLVRGHQVPFHALEKLDPARVVHRVSLTTRCDHLALLAEADVRGRVADDLPRLLDEVALFAQLCREQACFSFPRPFASDHSRFTYLRTPGRVPDYEAFDDTVCEVVLMSGLPGAGKDTWLSKNLPGLAVVSLDALRLEYGIAPEDPQGPIVERARDEAKELLRAGRPFALNATSVTRDVRGRWIDLFTAYRARVHLVHVEAPYRRLLEQNRQRQARVPERVLERLIDRWEPPDVTEGHRLTWVRESADPAC